MAERMRITAAENDGAAKQRMIEAATSLFSQSGVDGVSMRALTAAADVNLASVNYHFGSKEALAQTVFEALSARVNKQRIADIKQSVATAAQAGQPIKLETIVAIFVEPYLGEGRAEEGRLLAQLILKHRLTPSGMTGDIVRRHFDPMARHFIEAYAKACPKVKKEDRYWRYAFMVSTVVLTVTDQAKGNRVSRLSGGLVDAVSREALRSALIKYIVAGLAAA